MPIVEIIAMPNDLSAAYRPIVFDVAATNTDGSAIPPVVYCDIYFNGVFYKTISKSQYMENTGSATIFRFDIQDAAQEFLGKFLPNLAGSEIVTAPPLFVSCVCLFRSSGYDTEGFILPEGTAPIQGTGDMNPVAGTGSNSAVFDIINATLQHNQSQELRTHLAAWRLEGPWDPDNRCMPLTHRPLNYYLCPGDSDYFPIVTDKNPVRLAIEVIYKDGTGDTGTTDPVCVPVTIATPTSLPNAQVGVAYNVAIPLLGTGPFELLGDPVKPDWMTVGIVDSNIILSGTPAGGDVGTHIQISVSVQNCAESDFANFTKYIDVTTCVGVGWGSTLMPDAVAGRAYNKIIPLTGTAPFDIVNIDDKPDWMTIMIVGSNLVFSGTPADGDVDTGIPINVEISNCGALDDSTLSTSINVTESQNYNLLAAFNFKINSVTGTNVPALGATTVNGAKRGHHGDMSGTYTISITGTVVVATKIDVYINGILDDQVQVSTVIGTSFTDQTYDFTITATEADIVTFSIDSGLTLP